MEENRLFLFLNNLAIVIIFVAVFNLGSAMMTRAATSVNPAVPSSPASQDIHNRLAASPEGRKSNRPNTLMSR